MDELSDQLETDASRAPGYEDAASEHSHSFSLFLRELADTGFVSVQNFVKLGLYLKK